MLHMSKRQDDDRRHWCHSI